MTTINAIAMIMMQSFFAAFLARFTGFFSHARLIHPKSCERVL